MSIFNLGTKHPKESKGKIFYGWWIVTAGFSIQLLIGSLLIHSFTAYFPLLEEEFQWSRTVLSGAFALSRAESGLLGPLQGWLVEKVGPRLMVRLGMLLFGVGFMVFSQIDSILGYYIAFFLMAAGSSIAGHLTIATAIINWFKRKRGIAIGIASTGFSIGGLLVPIVAISVTSIGWRPTALYSGFLIIAIGIPVAQLMRRDPEPYGYLPDGDTHVVYDDNLNESQMSGKLMDDDSLSFTAKEAMLTRTFWLLSMGHALSLLTVGAVSLHLIPHVIDSVGLTVTTASTAVAVMTVFNVFGQIGGGFLGDRYSKRKICAIGALMHSLGLGILAFADNMVLVYLFALLHGSAWGLRGPLMATIRADYFGRSYFPSIMGFSSLVVMTGMTFGPLFAGYMADVFGDYKMGFVIIAALAALGAICFFEARQPMLPKRLLIDRV